MKLNERILHYIQTEVEKIHHGRIIIDLNDTRKNVDVTIETRERFQDGTVSIHPGD